MSGAGAILCCCGNNCLECAHCPADQGICAYKLTISGVSPNGWNESGYYFVRHVGDVNAGPHVLNEDFLSGGSGSLFPCRASRPWSNCSIIRFDGTEVYRPTASITIDTIGGVTKIIVELSWDFGQPMTIFYGVATISDCLPQTITINNIATEATSTVIPATTPADDGQASWGNNGLYDAYGVQNRAIEGYGGTATVEIIATNTSTNFMEHPCDCSLLYEGDCSICPETIVATISGVTSPSGINGTRTLTKTSNCIWQDSEGKLSVFYDVDRPSDTPTWYVEYSNAGDWVRWIVEVGSEDCVCALDIDWGTAAQSTSVTGTPSLSIT